MTWTLCSKEDVAALHPIQVADLMDEWSDMVEGLIRQHMGQPYLGTSQVIVDEQLSGDGTYTLHVKNDPIISIESLTVDGVLLQPDEYVFNRATITRRYTQFPFGVLNISISYTSGDMTPNPVLQLCAAAMIVAIINYRRRAGADGSRKWGETERKAGEPTANENLGLTSHLEKIMKRTLRRPSVRVRV